MSTGPSTRARSALLVAATIGATLADSLRRAGGGAARVLRQEIADFVKIPQEKRGPRPPRDTRRYWKTLSAIARHEKRGYFSLVRPGNTRGHWFQRPHSEPFFMAISRDRQGKRCYCHCFTYKAAREVPGVYVIEHINGFGQVKYRENLEVLARAEAARGLMELTLAAGAAHSESLTARSLVGDAPEPSW